MDVQGELQAGSLLVAAPTLVDPNFARTIVLLLDHGADGTLGVVLNRQSTVPVGEVLDDWAPVVSGPDVLFSGGPVETQAALAVGRLRVGADPVGWREVSERAGDRLGLVDLDTPPEMLADALEGLRIFAGYAGWGAGQLEGEIEEGSWYVVPSEPGDLFLADPAQLWGRVLRRQGGALAMLATQPADPVLN